MSLEQELYDSIMNELSSASFPLMDREELIEALMTGPQATYKAGQSQLEIPGIADLLIEKDFPLHDARMAAEAICERAGFCFLKLRGMSCANLSRYDEAIRYFDRSLIYHPEDTDALLGKASALNRMGFFSESLKVIKSIYQINRSSPEAWYLNGTILLQRGDIKEAIVCLDEAVKLDPGYIEALSSSGNCRYYLGDYQEAIDRYDQIIAINRSYPKAWYNKGVVLSEVRQYNEALRCYEEVLQINPGVASVWTNKGYCLAMLDKYNEALESFDIALNINPEDALALNNKAAALHRMGLEDEAAELAERVIDLTTGKGNHTVI